MPTRPSKSNKAAPKKKAASQKKAPSNKAVDRPTMIGSGRGRAALLKRLGVLLKGLKTLYPTVTCALTHRNDFELLVATILSAQCTDERVNTVTPELFAKYPDPAALAQADPEEIERLIYSTGFFRNKARSLLGTAQRLTDHYGGQLPRELAELITLPGVARKTANVVLGTAHGIASGIVVDTHVKRLSGRLGITAETTPEKIERDLMALLPDTEWIDFSHRLVWHGRKVCNARKPKCDECLLAPHCPSAFSA